MYCVFKICFLKIINYIEVQKDLFSINELNIELSIHFRFSVYNSLYKYSNTHRETAHCIGAFVLSVADTIVLTHCRYKCSRNNDSLSSLPLPCPPSSVHICIYPHPSPPPSCPCRETLNFFLICWTLFLNNWMPIKSLLARNFDIVERLDFEKIFGGRRLRGGKKEYRTLIHLEAGILWNFKPALPLPPHCTPLPLPPPPPCSPFPPQQSFLIIHKF